MLNVWKVLGRRAEAVLPALLGKVVSRASSSRVAELRRSGLMHLCGVMGVCMLTIKSLVMEIIPPGHLHRGAAVRCACTRLGQGRAGVVGMGGGKDG